MQSIATLSSPPPFACEPHMRSGPLAVWFTSPPGVVVQFVEPALGTLELVNWLVGPAYAELDRRAAGRRALMLVLDFGLMTARTNASRTVLLSKARQSAHRFAEVIVVGSYTATRTQLTSLHAGMALVRALGVRVSMAESALEAVDRLRLRASH